MGLIRFNAFADMLNYTSGSLPQTAPLTFMFNGRLSVDRNNYSCFFAQQKADGSLFSVCETDIDGTTLYWFVDGATQVGGVPITVGTNYFIAGTDPGTGVATLYLRNLDTMAAMTSYSALLPVAARTMDEWHVGSDNAALGSEFLNGCVGALRIYTRSLSGAEVLAASDRFNPDPTVADLYAFWPLSATTDMLLDFSGNGRNLVANGAGPWTAEAQATGVPWVVDTPAPATLTLGAFPPTITGSAASGFSGTATFAQTGAEILRITGLTLPAGQTGTIGVAGSGADVLLPASFPTAVDAAAAALGLTMADMVEVLYQQTGGAGPSLVNVSKLSAPFTVSFANATATSSGPLEIYLRYFRAASR